MSNKTRDNPLLIQSKAIAEDSKKDTLEVIDMISERVNKEYPHLGFVACSHEEFRDICIEVRKELT